MKFKEFAEVIRNRFYSMAKSGPLFVVDIEKEKLLEAYQGAFPPGTNEIFRERREHDCNNCNKFISRIGRVVQIVDNELVTVWGSDGISGKYKIISEKMNELIKSCKISNIFLIDPQDSQVGVESNIEDLITPRSGHNAFKDPKGLSYIKWYHFSCVVPDRYLSPDKGTKIGEASSTRAVFKRGLEEIDLASIEIVLDLIDNNCIYRGEEFRNIIKEFEKHKEIYLNIQDDKEKEYHTWLNYNNFSAKIRGTAIGTLLLDLSTGVELNDAIASYEKKVAPENYKRTSAPITKGMIDKAIEKIDELGLRDALERRYARLEDVSVNNVLFADRSASKVMKDSLAALLSDEVKGKDKFGNIKEMPIEQFINEVIPHCSNIEVQFTNKHENNLVSLVAPIHADSPLLFKWENNFSWAYNGDVTDSLMKQRVKSMGGNIDAYLRFSIQWNENLDNENDFDAHVKEPNGNHIFFSNKGIVHPSSGHLDVDIIRPDRRIAVENITYTNPTKMPSGIYDLFVHNYTHRGGRSGFRAELEFDGIIYKFSYDKDIPNNQNVTVARISFSKENGIKIIESLPHDKTSKEIWGIRTEKFHRVNAIMYSPNHWDDMGIGNRHYFFMLENCKNDGKARGFYNEFLKNELSQHRKVFEVLGGKMKCEESQDQVSGLGFSSTKHDSVVVRTTGSITRNLRLLFSEKKILRKCNIL